MARILLSKGESGWGLKSAWPQIPSCRWTGSQLVLPISVSCGDMHIYFYIELYKHIMKTLDSDIKQTDIRGELIFERRGCHWVTFLLTCTFWLLCELRTVILLAWGVRRKNLGLLEKLEKRNFYQGEYYEGEPLIFHINCPKL